MLVGLTLAGLLLRRLGLDEAIARAGERGPVVFTTLAALACAVGVPRQVVAYAGGLAFGIWPGVALAMVAELAGCAADFWWARLLARRWAVRYLWRWAWIARLERFLVANAFSATLTLRLLPVGSNIALNLLAGVSAVSAVPFLAASALGYVPQTVVFALAGGGMRMSQWLTMGLGAALLLLSVGLGIVLMRRRPIPGMGAAPSA
jgi:uncharacterized membrane protein YdjX (TVP38/TMEM64 family)